MDRAERTSIQEHLALHSPLGLEAFCESFRKTFGLPEFEYDAENETEWGLVEVNNIEYNISRPYRPGTLRKCGNSVPRHCTFGITLSVFREHPEHGCHEWAYRNLVVPVAVAMAKAFQTPVYYHRTWYKEGKNVERNETFTPNAAQQH